MLSQVPWGPQSKLHRAAEDKHDDADDDDDEEDEDEEDKEDKEDENSLILQKSPVQCEWQLQVPEARSKLP